MLSLETYKVFHIVGVVMVIGALTSAGALSWSGVPKTAPASRLSGVTHGAGLLIVLICGFGMLARGGFSMGQGWVVGKLVIWLLLGAMLMPTRRMPERTPLWWLICFALAGTAAYLALFKPF